MSLVVPPGFGLASIILSGNVGTSPYATTIGVGITDYEGDYVGAANHVMAAYASVWAPFTNDDLTIDRVTLFVGADGPSGSVDSNLTPVPGTRSVPITPTACSLILRKQTTDLGRAGRGRMFIPGVLADGDVDEAGRIESASVSLFNAAADDFYLALNDITDTPATLPYLLHAERPGTPPPTIIQGFGVAPICGWIRKRIR